MAKIITRIISGFDSNFRAILNIPNGAESVALRFYETTEIHPDPERLDAQVAVVVLVDSPPIIPGTHQRRFILVHDGAAIPSNFKKYVATFPYGPNKVIVHLIEISV